MSKQKRTPAYMRRNRGIKQNTKSLKVPSVEKAYDNAVAALQFLSTAIYTENAKDVDNMEEVNNMITVLTVLLSDYFKVEEV